MNFETNRLNTFANWPSSAPVDPIRIAKAGFYYRGEGIEVQCFSCGGIISQWNYGDQVMMRHRHMEPNCEFVVNPRLSGNVPLVLNSECPSNVDSSTSWTASEDSNNDTPDTSQDYGLTEEDTMYQIDALRLLSFASWNDTSVSREALVRAGFYHAGEGKLRCAWCGGELAPFRRFGALGPPLDVHRMYFPRCAHAAQLDSSQRTGSVSSDSSSPSHTSPIQTPTNTDDTNQQSSGAELNARLLESGRTWRALGVVSGGARHPTRASLSARLATFGRWPADRHQAPQTLAEAGFFYTGTADQVCCFYCDGGLGKWEAGDTPWSEHAHWFPHCGYVILVKGQDFVDACRQKTLVQRTVSADSGLRARRTNPGVHFTITDSQVEEGMESTAALAALSAGLDAARVRRAVSRRLRSTGLPFSSSEALIDAVLDEQLNEEAWSVSPQSQRLARDILAETLREFAPGAGIIPSWDDRPGSQTSTSTSPPRTPSPIVVQAVRSSPSIESREEVHVEQPPFVAEAKSESKNQTEDSPAKEKKPMSLEEENRQLKEARLCKVCMDSEVSVVFLPCGHLVSCARCGAALSACPLCRSAVKALVRAYLA